MTTDRIEERNGYVLGVRCAKGHDDNRRLALDGDWAECCGCRQLIHRETVADCQDAARAGRRVGENMAGGLYSVPDDYAQEVRP